MLRDQEPGDRGLRDLMPGGRRFSLRVRITASTVAIVLAVLAVGGFAVVALLERSLVGSEAQTAEDQAQQFALDSATAGELAKFDADEVIIQLQLDGVVVGVADDDLKDTLPLPVSERERSCACSTSGTWSSPPRSSWTAACTTWWSAAPSTPPTRRCAPRPC